MKEYVVTKEGLQDLLNKNDKKELQQIYELCLENKVVAHSHHEFVALFYLILKFKWEEFTLKHTKIDFYFNLKNFKNNNEVMDLYRLIRRTHYEIGMTIIKENDPIEEKVKVEFLELYSTFLFLFFNQLRCVDICNNALFRDPTNATTNFFKASLLDLALIVKHPDHYDCAIQLYRQQMLKHASVSKVKFDKTLTQSILKSNYNFLPIPYPYNRIFRLFEIPDNIMETPLGKQYWSEEFDYYLKNKLFLNPLNNFGNFAQAAIEDLQELSLSTENISMFESVVEDYKFCRKKVYEYSHKKTISKREMCATYCFLYSLFDKIAFLLKNVYKIDVEADAVSFTQGKLFDRKYKDCQNKFFEIPNPSIIPIYLESVEGRSKNNIKGLDIGTFELNEFRNTIEHKSTDLIDEHILKSNTVILIQKIRNLIIETYLLLQSANTNLTSDDIVLVGTAFAKALFDENEKQNIKE